MIVVVTDDPDDALRVAGALGLLDRHLRAQGRRLPSTLRCPVVHAPAVSSRQEPTPLDAPAPAPDPAAVPLLLTYDQTAARLNASRRTVERLVATGVLPARRLGRRSLIAPDDLERFAGSLPTTRRTS